jgi:hypothetical protein
MPAGPNGEKRPADVIGNAVKSHAHCHGRGGGHGADPSKELHRKGGLKGGKAYGSGFVRGSTRDRFEGRGGSLEEERDTTLDLTETLPEFFQAEREPNLSQLLARIRSLCYMSSYSPNLIRASRGAGRKECL